MTKCKYCGYEPETTNDYTVGNPCGFDGCMEIFCCIDSWYDHVKEKHPKYFEEHMRHDC